jgi:hypothetical protein
LRTAEGGKGRRNRGGGTAQDDSESGGVCEGGAEQRARLADVHLRGCARATDGTADALNAAQPRRPRLRALAAFGLTLEAEPALASGEPNGTAATPCGNWQSRCRCGRGEPRPSADVGGVSPVPVQTKPRCRWGSDRGTTAIYRSNVGGGERRERVPGSVDLQQQGAPSRCRCGRSEPGPGADVGGVRPVPVQMWAG